MTEPQAIYLPAPAFYGPAELAQAFPAPLCAQALAGAEAWMRWCRRDYTSERFTVLVGGEAVLIPQRLLIEGYWPAPELDPALRDMGLCLASRSTDGHQRQRALRGIVGANRAWTIPFVVALAGEYVVEILEDIEAALPGIDPGVAGCFLAQNPAYFALTRARVASYWNEYHRRRIARRDYVGFRLIDAFEDMIAGHRRGGEAKHG